MYSKTTSINSIKKTTLEVYVQSGFLKENYIIYYFTATLLANKMLDNPLPLLTVSSNYMLYLFLQ